MNRVAYILNGNLYINPLPLQKFLSIDPVVVKNPKSIERTGGKKTQQGHEDQFLGNLHACHEDVQWQQMYAPVSWEEAGLCAVVPTPPGAVQLHPVLLFQQC